MTENIKNQAGQPRVFLSYAHIDGEHFTNTLRMRLEAEGIPLWQDRVGMEGGRDWWLQIVEALDMVEFMVLIMTPAALQSTTVRKEWRYARQKGVCVYPVKVDSNIDFTNLPRWMRDVHWYDIIHEWKKFISDLNTQCQKRLVPFMVEDLPPDFIERSNEFEQLIGLLLDAKSEEPVAITAALRGAGGYGKTTMATALCHDEQIQEAFDDGILWITLGENPGNLVEKLEDLIYILSKERPGFTSLDTATTYFAKLLEDRDILLVIDDVWNAAHLKPFCQGGKRCARLITTRIESVLPPDAQRIQVDAMRQGEAMHLLGGRIENTAHLPEAEALRKLSARLGEWPLLLKLVNGALRERVSRNQSLLDAIAYTNEALDECGLTIFDARDARDRSQAVAKTLSVSFKLLNDDEYARYKELAVFPEDINIPLSTLEKLWSATGGLGKFKTEKLCEDFYRLSLVLSFDLITRTLRLHDVVRVYLRNELGVAELAALEGRLLDSYNLKRWADLPHDEPYMWGHLAEHLFGAGRGEELITTVKDGAYLAAKIFASRSSAIEADLDRAESLAPTDASLDLLKRSIASMSHLLNRCTTRHEVACVLHSRLSHLKELVSVCSMLEQAIARPFLTSWYALPDLPSAALIRTLQGHTHFVRGCMISASGNLIISASNDRTLKVWDTHMGLERFSLTGHTDWVTACAISPTGDYIVSASGDRTLKVWNTHTGLERITLTGHTNTVSACAVSPTGDYIVSASYDRTLKLWDIDTGLERFSLTGHTDWVTACAISPTGDYIVSASNDKTLKVWDAHTGVERLTLTGHTASVTACAIFPSGHLIVSSSDDGTLKLWDIDIGTERLTFTGHKHFVKGCAVSPSGDYIVSASRDRTLKVWDMNTRAERLTLKGHMDWVNACAVSPLGDFIISASDDKTLKVWNARMEAAHLTSIGHTDWVNCCAVSSSGDLIVSASYDRTLKVWDAHPGTERLTLTGHTDYVTWCAVSSSGDLIVSASRDGTLKVWNVHLGIQYLTLIGHTDWVNCCAMSPTDDYIVSASNDCTLKLWDAHTGDERRTLKGHTGWVTGCSLSPVGDYIVSASRDHTLKVWDMQTGLERFTLAGHTDWVYGCAVSPIGDYIVSASDDKTLKVWDAHTGLERFTLTGHTDWLNSCAVSPTGKYIVSASNDRTLRLWDAYTGACLATLPVASELRACGFCPDGQHLVAGGVGGVYFLRLLT